MELNPGLTGQARRLLPSWLLDRLDPVSARMWAAVDRLADELPPGCRVLDAGCGENHLRKRFAHCRFTGCDRAVGDPRWDYQAVQVLADLHRLPFADASFDAVLNLVVLEHLTDPGAALAEIGRVLRPGGRLLLVAPLLWEEHQSPHDYYRFTRHGLARLLAGAGLAIEQIRPLGGFFTLLARRSINALQFFQGGWRWPLFVLLAPGLGVALPLLLRALDGLDREQRFTLGYEVWAVRPPTTRTHSQP